MDRSVLEQEIIRIVGAENVLTNESMARHTTFRVGGKARYFVTVPDEASLKALLLCLKSDTNIERLPVFLLGNGSNLLVSDSGYEGVIVRLGESFGQIQIISRDASKGTDMPLVETVRLRAGAGVMLGRLAAFAAEQSLTGLEYASGIPGTVGGALVMNAGAYGGEMKQVVRLVRLYDRESGEIREVSADEMRFSYRHSILKDKPYVALSAEIELRVGDPDAIRGKMEELKEQRREKQPLEYPSAGSTFKRPEGNYAGKLIMDAGLRGYRVGNAAVSEKHCGFVINEGGATASEIYRLIEDVRKAVSSRFGVELEPEVLFLGEF